MCEPHRGTQHITKSIFKIGHLLFVLNFSHVASQKLLVRVHHDYILSLLFLLFIFRL